MYVKCNFLANTNVLHLLTSLTNTNIELLAIATYEEIKNAHEHSTARMRLGLRVSLLIGNIQICVLGYILQLRPIISFHAYVRVLRITH